MAVASIVTVATLAVLVVQTLNLRSQLQLEIKSRRQDERERRQDRERANTPYLSIEGGPCEFRESSFRVSAELHADGDGVAHNVVPTLWRPTPTVPQIMAIEQPIRYFRAVDSRALFFEVPIGYVPQLPLDACIDVVYLNQFDQQVKFSQAVRLTRDELKTLNAPQYTWPWSGADLPTTGWRWPWQRPA